jgi:hypothetical protein
LYARNTGKNTQNTGKNMIYNGKFKVGTKILMYTVFYSNYNDKEDSLYDDPLQTEAII